MDSAFTLSIGWLTFTVLAIRPQETMKVLGGDWSKAKGGFRGYPLSWIKSDGLHGVGKLGTNAPRRPNEIHVDLSGGLVSALSLEQIAVLLKWVHAQQGHVTRIDCALDDRAGTVPVTRTGTAGAATPKRDRRTFLGNHTWPHITPSPAGNVWSITIHDFGKQWVEMSWGKVDPIQSKKGEKGASRNRKMNEARARGRAKGTIRKKCLTIGADHLVTLTYRANMEDRDRVLHDLERLRRALSRLGCSMPYVAVLERQQRGALHPHLAVKGCSAPAMMLVQDPALSRAAVSGVCK